MIRRAIVFTGLLLLASGCGTMERKTNLQMVAKDWCMVIRASQVVPVYPLTEDLQVGDIFLVQRTVDDQHTEYEERGFLPMDNLLGRLRPAGYYRFYKLSFAADETSLHLPKDWLHAGEESVSWGKAPGANFPSYSFSVRSGGGLNVAVPLQGVPVGLSLMGADGGEGTIAIREAKTYGIDTISLYNDVLAWERKHREFLLHFASTEEKTNYVRVISRVYLAKSMNVSVRASRAREAGLTAGAPKPVELLTIKTAKDESGLEAATTENYTNGVKTLNDSIAKALEAIDEVGNVLPGGTLKVVAASSRAITMEETFERPLAVGYLGFDMLIGPDGCLGPPIPTHAVLSRKIAPEAAAADTIQLLGNARLTSAYGIICEQADAGEKKAVWLKAELDRIAKLLPKTYPVPIYSTMRGTKQVEVQILKDTPLRPDPPEFDVVPTYRGQLLSSSGALGEADKQSAERNQWLQPTQKALEDVRLLLRQNSILLEEASKYAGYFET